MKDRIKDIDDLFSMFHDFEIVGLKVDGNILTMEILLPWSEMWDIEDYKMTFRFDLRQMISKCFPPGAYLYHLTENENCFHRC